MFKIILNKQKTEFFFVVYETFFIFLESSETRFNFVTGKIGEKLNNVVIYGDILVNFLLILSEKSFIFKKIKFGKLYFYKF